MNNYVTGSTIRALRESKNLTQSQLAEILCVSDKAVSRWETGKGFPDISLIEPISKTLGISVIELISGECITNHNKSANAKRSKFYVCPICGNIIHCMGKALISCCGITLPYLEAEESDDSHNISIQNIDDEIYVNCSHEMSKTHYISFIAYVTSDKVETVKLYPESDAHARFLARGDGEIYYFCNRHGLFKHSYKR